MVIGYDRYNFLKESSQLFELLFNKRKTERSFSQIVKQNSQRYRDASKVINLNFYLFFIQNSNKIILIIIWNHKPVIPINSPPAAYRHPGPINSRCQRHENNESERNEWGDCGVKSNSEVREEPNSERWKPNEEKKRHQIKRFHLRFRRWVAGINPGLKRVDLMCEKWERRGMRQLSLHEKIWEVVNWVFC